MSFNTDYNRIAYGGNTSLDEGAVVYLYANSGSVDSWINTEIKNALDSALSTLVSANAIDYFEIYRYNGPEEYPKLGDATRNDFKTNFPSYLSNDIDDSYYPGLTGCHFGIASGFDDAGGEATGSDAYSTAFATSNWMVLGTASNKEKRIKSFSIQEPMHTFISYDMAVDYGLVRSGSESHELDTGVIYSSGAVSPMLTTWTNCESRPDHSGHGQCAPDNTCDGSYSQDITGCTGTAVKYTADKVFGNPLPTGGVNNE